MKPALRKTLLVAATVFAIATPAAQALLDLGIDQAQFAADGDETLRAAGYAFSIWTLIYGLLIAHAAAQVMDRGRSEALFVRLAPSIGAIAGCGLWIIASAMNARWPSVVIIIGSAAMAYWALDRARGAQRGLARGMARGLGEQLLGVAPIALLGGWLLIASAVNILTVMTAEGLIAETMRNAFALGGIGVVAALAVLAMWRGVSVIYGLPVAWGFVAVFVAQRGDQPVTAFAALAAGVLVLAACGAMELRRRERL